MQVYAPVFPHGSRELPCELAPVALPWAVHAEAALTGIEEVGVALHLAACLVGEPLDQARRLLAQEVGESRIALVIVLLEDILRHQLGVVIEDTGLPLEAGAGRGDQARRAHRVAGGLSTLLKEQHPRLAPRRREGRNHPARARPNDDEWRAAGPGTTSDRPSGRAQGAARG